ncbi:MULTISPECIES: M6 family metalloprotease domain-containing protein [Streptomycetaceae]|uniref:M6 family metalloprotease domain-containing protein n=1 Tax=Streptantibioticus cattleyicolor (strain ATCC 35852 / DSM 46488 / JCM 4925 / NBRC 14057 / NRRL 8057) TaxID=1003195 RepID=F8JWG2_STREN|nr:MULTISPECIES: M6 family metalloprotease domain-containing protein [Streptomycetaceae]AEW95742.1 hypothetical protein SCATT_33710 [Streptantibioticus cattleyicolor NRRL 8057 = DSM 46488]MYS60287.1 M6 family metalloprotease domain-containing protein [Streptomyces sp. SID5468]CCB76082.1 conserved exported protein of unknown function [Streptantibioticus cattleyicolor NRRL 8057 = DSM 46488]
MKPSGRVRSVLLCLLVWAAVTAAPGAAAPGADPVGPCALPRTDAWLSEGVTPWDDAHVRPLGTVRAAMVFVRFPDHVPRRAPRQVESAYLPSVPKFYLDASYGKARLAIDPVERWITLPRTAAGYGIHRGTPYDRTVAYLRDTVRAAHRAGVGFPGDRLLYVVADPDAPGVDHDATAAVTLAARDTLAVDGTRIRNVALIWEAATPDRNVVAHETGHLFGLPDLYVQPQGAGGDWDSMVGDWDLMGDQRAAAPEFLAWNKWKFGWFDPGQVECVAAPGVSRHTLTPTEVTGGTKLVVVAHGPTDAYAIEARSPYGNDRGLCAPGVLVYHVRTTVDSTLGPIDVRNAHPGTVAADLPATADGPSGVPGVPRRCARVQEPSMARATLQPGESYTADGGALKVTVVAERPDGDYLVDVTAGPPAPPPGRGGGPVAR